MSEVLVHVTRGKLIESMHRGDIAVVNNQGQLLYSIGDPYKLTFTRSAGKPIQAMEVIITGTADKYAFTDDEIAIMCASHYGEDIQRQTVIGILNKIGLTTRYLLCGITTSLNPEYALELAINGVELDPTFNDCSGKHAGMLAICQYKGYDIKTYNSPDHPLQIDMKNLILKFCAVSAEQLIIGIDGCSVPVFGMPLYNMALAFAKLANPQLLAEPYQKAADTVFQAMNNAPKMIAGTDGFCTELIKQAGGKLIGKLGAEGVYCIGVKDKNLGIAVKMEDGDVKRSLYPTVMQCLEDLDILTTEELLALNRFKVKSNINHSATVVGEIKPIFNLK